MLVRWSPPDAAPQEWIVKPLELESAESEAIELVGDAWWQTYDQFGRLFMRGSARAHRAMIWVLLCRTDPGLAFDEVSIRHGDVFVDFDADELSAMRAGVEADVDLDPRERDYVLAALDRGEAPAAVAPDPSRAPST